MARRLIRYSFYILALVIITGFYIVERNKISSIQASSSDSASGYAWSENIGWLSFNCTDLGTCAQSNYGVNVDIGGTFSGYAWSEHIGWVKFDPAGPYPSAPNTSVILNMGNNEVSGWARACAAAADPINCTGGANPNSGGWDGWIKFRKHSSDGGGVPSYGVTYDQTTGDFHGWAWGSDVVGWISMNCAEGGNGGANVCAQSNYKVIAPSISNQPPLAIINCDPTTCIGYTGDVFTLKNDSTDPNGQGDIIKSEWDVLNFGSAPDITCTSPPRCDYTVPTQSLGAGTFQATLKVEDKKAATSTSPPKSFTLKQDAVASFRCSLDQATWKACSDIKATKGETVYFQDQSTPSEGAASITAWSWSFINGSPSSSTQQNPNTKFQSTGSKSVSLTVTDSVGRTDTSDPVTINVGLSFPSWEEISPF